MNFCKNMCKYVDNGKHIEIGKYPYKRIIKKDDPSNINRNASTKRTNKDIPKSLKKIKRKMVNNSRKINRG